jgi:NAD(P)-dependent dehydrogenase (short-subunit alcohol dehydrogenase family)
VTRLADKVVFISGATSGIGKVAAGVFAREGAKVVLTGRRESEGEAAAAAIRADGGEALFVRMDVADETAVKNAVRNTIDRFGALHVLFNNAGGSSNADGNVTSASIDEFWRVIRCDLFGTFLCCRYAIPEIIRSGGGAVINNASMVAIKGELNRDAYTAAKGGVVAMTRSMARYASMPFARAPSRLSASWR